MTVIKEQIKKEVVIHDLKSAAHMFERDGTWIHLIEEHYKTEIFGRGNSIQIIGAPDDVEKSMTVIDQILHMVKQRIRISDRQVRMIIEFLDKGKFHVLKEMEEDIVNMTKNGECIRPRTLGQKIYLDAIRSHSVTFGIGPAGTGKTYLAVALAAFYLRNHDVQKIILVRPAVEAGEKLGFLPGDLQEKVNPYLRPLFDGLLDMFGPEEFLKLQQKGQIEVAPLAYMRGRTLEKAFVILDEAQNTTVEQLKMFLTRLGFRSKMVVNGDTTQIDLPEHIKSGLVDAQRVLHHIPDISFVKFTENDVVRHDLVAAIIRAYEQDAKRKHRGEGNDGHHD